jgi:hypothetical protein
MKKIAINICILFFTNSLFSQSNFFKKFEGKNASLSTAVSVLHEENNFCIASFVLDDLSRPLINIMSLDSVGNKLWEINEEDDIYGYRPAVDKALLKIDDNMFLLFGMKYKFSQPDSTYIHYIFFDKNGNVLKRISHPVLVDYAARSISLTSDGNLMAYYNGFIETNPVKSYNFLVKTKIDGELIWHKKLENPSEICVNEYGHHLLLSTGEFLIINQAYTCIDFQKKVQYTKTDIAGNIIWTKQLPIEPYSTQNYGAVERSDGKYMIYYNIYKYVNGFGPSSNSISCTDTAGNIVWNRVFIPLSNSVDLQKMIIMPNDDMIVFGTKVDTFKEISFFIKIDSAGTLIWDRYYSVSYPPPYQKNSSIYMKDGISLSDNCIAITGVVEDTVPSLTYFKNKSFLLVVDSAGCYNGNCDTKNVLDIDDKTDIPQYLLIKIYPNPANHQITLHLSSDIKLTGFKFYITDILGNQIEHVNFNSGNDVIINTSNYPAGVYFLQGLKNEIVVDAARFIINH